MSPPSALEIAEWRASRHLEIILGIIPDRTRFLGMRSGHPLFHIEAEGFWFLVESSGIGEERLLISDKDGMNLSESPITDDYTFELAKLYLI